MDWILWLFIALVASPLIYMAVSPISAARKEIARQEAEARQAERREADKRRAAEDKARAAAALQAAQQAETAARKADQQRRKAEREREQCRRRAEKLAAARELAEYQERALRAEKELQALRSSAPSAAPVQPRPAAAPADATAPAPTPAPSPSPAPAPDPGKTPAAPAQSAPQVFAGQLIAFTGVLPTMTRAEAIKAVEDRGGRAYETVNTSCTMLVVGQRAGTTQLDRARKWNVETVTWEEWFRRAGISWRRRQVAQSMMKQSRAPQRPTVIS